jgi:hypothetical protein
MKFIREVMSVKMASSSYFLIRSFNRSKMAGVQTSEMDVKLVQREKMTLCMLLDLQRMNNC